MNLLALRSNKPEDHIIGLSGFNYGLLTLGPMDIRINGPYGFMTNEP